MKNLFVIAVLLFAFSSSSCKKEYTCECTWTDPIFGTKETHINEFGKQKEEDAKNKCEEQKTEFTSIDANAACVLKEK